MNQPTIDPTKVFIKDMNMSLNTKIVLACLGVHSVYDLYVMHLLDVVPAVGTDISTYPFISYNVVYTEEMDKTVKMLLKKHFNIEELKNVGVS